MGKVISRSLADTQEVAQKLLSTIKPGTKAAVVALQGDLGSGKTTFAQAVGSALGVGENMSSPTFVIEKIYEIDWQGFKKLIHIDAYRLEKEEEILHLGWQEIIERPENLILIEWPERVTSIMPAWSQEISFTFIDEHTREITLPESERHA